MTEAGTVLFPIMSRSYEVDPKGLFPVGKEARARNVEFTCFPLYAFMVWCLAPELTLYPYIKNSFNTLRTVV